jgi:hypothetical protein
LPAQQAIPHSCDDAKEPGGTTPASTTTSSKTARTIRAIDARALMLVGRETNKGKAPFGLRGVYLDGRILAQE